MKLAILIILALVCFFPVSAQVTQLEEFNQSLRAWRSLNAYAYSYTVPFQSGFGFSDVTTINVFNMTVVRRDFRSFQQSANGEEIPLDHWVETRPMIGSHNEGAPARTMEENYNYCRNEVLTQDPNENTIYFAVDDRGILKQCAYFPHGCADDCLTGITIGSLNLFLFK